MITYTHTHKAGLHLKHVENLFLIIQRERHSPSETHGTDLDMHGVETVQQKRDKWVQHLPYGCHRGVDFGIFQTAMEQLYVYMDIKKKKGEGEKWNIQHFL